MKSMTSSWFKTHCLRVLDEIHKLREPVLITKRGVPVVKIVPVDVGSSDVFGCLAGRLEIVGDLETPIVSSRQWKSSR